MATRPHCSHLVSAVAFVVGFLITVAGGYVSSPPPPVTEIVAPMPMGALRPLTHAAPAADTTLREELERLALQRDELQRRVAALEQRVARVSSELRVARLEVRSRASRLMAAGPSLHSVARHEPIAPEPSPAILTASHGPDARRFSWLRFEFPEHQPVAPNPPSSR
jgi:hypothetical protein